MEDLLKKIAGQIIEADNSQSPMGLFHGNAGISMFLYMLSRHSKDLFYEKKAEELLDKVFTGLNNSVSPDLEDGLAGIGWVTEYLIQHKFVEGDPDIILEEVDNKVFKILNEDNFNSLEVTNGLAGYLFYLIRRLKNTPEEPSMAFQINSELLIHVINKIYEIGTAQFPSIVKDVQFDLFWRFPAMLLGLTEAYKLNIYNQKIRCIYQQWLYNFEAYMPYLHINRLFLALAYSSVNSQFQNKRLEWHIRVLLHSIDYEKIPEESDPKQPNLRFGWPGILALLARAEEVIDPLMPRYDQINICMRRIWHMAQPELSQLSLSSFFFEKKNRGLSEGLAGIGMLLLMRGQKLFEKRFLVNDNAILNT